MAGASGEEMVEEVGIDGRVVRLVTRREMRAKRLRHRSVFVLVRSTQGGVLIHRRSDEKDIWPGWWDIAVGGVVAPGEDWDTAARRELAEEIGVDARPVAIDDGAAVPFDDEEVSLLARRYEVIHDGPFRFADGEVVEARFVDVDRLRDLVREISVLPDSRSLFARHLDL